MNELGLFELFDQSISMDAGIRGPAERRLAELSQSPRFIPALLHLLSHPAAALIPQHFDSMMVARARQALAIYLKNNVLTGWHAESERPISLENKTVLRTTILPLLVLYASAPDGAPTKSQLYAILYCMLQTDFPGAWGGLINTLTSYIENGNEAQTEVSLTALVYLFKTQGYTTERAILDSLTSHFMPRLLALAQRAADPAASERTHSFLYLIFKAYKNGIAHRLAPHLRESDVTAAWLTLFVNVIDAPLPSSEARSRAVKWALHCITRQFSHFGSPPRLVRRDRRAEYLAYAETFVAEYAPTLLDHMLGLGERIANDNTVSSAIIVRFFLFLEECLRPGAVWQRLKPHIDAILTALVVPRIGLSDEDRELFTEDPAEFCRAQFAEGLEDGSAASAAARFVAALARDRPQTLHALLALVERACREAHEPEHLESALRLLGSVSKAAITAGVPGLDTVLLAVAVPALDNPSPLVRFRAATVLEAYERDDVEWRSQAHLDTAVDAVLRTILDPELPVRVAAIFFLPEVVRYEHVRERVRPNVTRIIQEVLRLANEVDIEPVIEAVRVLVGEYYRDVSPFANELSAQLIDSYMRLAREAVEEAGVDDAIERAAENDPSLVDTEGGASGNARGSDGVLGQVHLAVIESDDIYFNDDEKVCVCGNLLRTLDQLTEPLVDAPELVDAVSGRVLPALDYSLRYRLVDLYEDVFETLGLIVHTRRAVSPDMWRIFETTFAVFSRGASEYFGEISPFLSYILTYGRATVLATPLYQDMFFSYVRQVLEDKRLGADDRGRACHLAQKLLVLLPTPAIDRHVPGVISAAMVFITRTSGPALTSSRALELHCINTVLICIIYNPTLAFDSFERAQGSLAFFLAEWQNALSRLVRSHDIRISVIAITCIFQYIVLMPTAPAAMALVSSAHNLMVTALLLLGDFPEAFQRHRMYLSRVTEDLRNEAADGGDDEETAGDAEGATEGALDAGGNRDDDGDIVEQEYPFHSTMSYTDDADAWTSDGESESPLTQIDLYAHFVTVMRNIEANSPEMYNQAVANLSPEKRAELASIAMRASSGGEQTLIETASKPPVHTRFE